MTSLENDIVEFLEHLPSINFRCCGVRVYNQGYTALGRALRNRHIQVIYNTRVGNNGVYSSATNAMRVGFERLVHLHDKALVVHEMTHALQDYHRRRLRTLDAECAAYVAQAIFLERADPGQGIVSGELLSQSEELAILGTMAQSVARQLIGPPSRYQVPNREEELMRGYVSATPIYRRRADNTIEFNGLRPTDSSRP